MSDEKDKDKDEKDKEKEDEGETKERKKRSDKDEDEVEDKKDEDEEDKKTKEKEERSRTVELCFATPNAGVVRTDPGTGETYLEILSLEPSAVDLSRLNSGAAPLLDSHSQDGLNKILGVIERAWIDPETSEGRVKARFSKRAEVDPILQDVRDKIIVSTSVGYEVKAYKDITKAGDQMPVRLITQWCPGEVSLVSVPADKNAGIRKEMRNRIVNQEQDLVQQEITRGLEIRKAVRVAKLSEEFADTLVSKRTSIDDARKSILDELAKQGETQTRFQTQVNIQAGAQDERETFRKGLENAFLHRLNPTKNPLKGPGQQFEALTMFDMAKECAKRSMGGGYFAPYPGAVMERAFSTTSDFPMLLQNVVGKLLRESFESAPATYQAFTKTVQARDFKPMYRLQLGEAPALEPLNEHGEYKMGSMSETRETYRIQTYGKRLALTRETIINDDLSVFQRIPNLMGRAAADHISDTVYNTLTSDYVMGDGVKLFDPGHRNVADKASSITIDSLSEARTKIRLHTGQAGRLLNLSPKILLIPAALETKAQQYLSQSYLYGVMKAQAEQNVNPFAGAFQVVVEPRLDAKSPTTWYMVVDPGMIDTMELAFLEGQSGPYIDSRQGFETSGIEWIVRMEYGVAPIEWRAFYRNPGA